MRHIGIANAHKKPHNIFLLLDQPCNEQYLQIQNCCLGTFLPISVDLKFYLTFDTNLNHFPTVNRYVCVKSIIWKVLQPHFFVQFLLLNAPLPDHDIDIHRLFIISV